MDPLVAIECSSEAVRVDDSYEDLSSKTDLGVIKTVSRQFLDPIEIVFIYSRSGRHRAIKWDRRVMKASENILSTTYFASDGCQMPLPIFIKYERHAFIYYQVKLLSDDGLWKYFTTYFANFHKIWTKCSQLALSTFMNGTKVVWTLWWQNGFSLHPTKTRNYWMKVLTNFSSNWIEVVVTRTW